MKPTYHVYGNTYSFTNDPEQMARMRKSAKELQDFKDEMKEFVVNMDIPYDSEDGDLIFWIARIVELTGGTMPYPVCTTCGSIDDGHSNNNGECEL